MGYAPHAQLTCLCCRRFVDYSLLIIIAFISLHALTLPVLFAVAVYTPPRILLAQRTVGFILFCAAQDFIVAFIIVLVVVVIAAVVGTCLASTTAVDILAQQQQN